MAVKRDRNTEHGASSSSLNNHQQSVDDDDDDNDNDNDNDSNSDRECSDTTCTDEPVPNSKEPLPPNAIFQLMNLAGDSSDNWTGSDKSIFRLTSL